MTELENVAFLVKFELWEYISLNPTDTLFYLSARLIYKASTCNDKRLFSCEVYLRAEGKNFQQLI